MSPMAAVRPKDTGPQDYKAPPYGQPEQPELPRAPTSQTPAVPPQDASNDFARCNWSSHEAPYLVRTFVPATMHVCAGTGPLGRCVLLDACICSCMVGGTSLPLYCRRLPLFPGSSPSTYHGNGRSLGPCDVGVSIARPASLDECTVTVHFFSPK